MPAWRLRFLITALAVATLALGLRLVQIQIIEYERYRSLAEEEHWSRQPVYGPRGAITDRSGHPLALEVPVFDLYLEPNPAGGEKQKESVANSLAPLLGMKPEEIMTLWQDGEGPIPLKRDLPYDQGTHLASLNLPGVKLTQRRSRVYPEGNLAATLLGFVGRDQIGLAGLEKDIERAVAGVPGELIFERDSFGRPIPTGFYELIPPKPGGRLVLTIDRFIQRLVERELEDAIAKHDASGGTIIVMNPHTGEVLAMASRPSFDLTKLDLENITKEFIELTRNRAITDVYEPGSVFKLITMAAALNEGLITPGTTFFDAGPVRRYGWTIDTWNGAHHGRETMTEVLQNSCNVGAIWVSDLLGPERFYKYVDRFGFGTPTYIGLSGEATGQVRHPGDENWSPIEPATNSFGQGLSVTPLQMITAVAAIANGGNLMRPYIVKEIQGGEEARLFQPVVVRRVISEEAARALSGMMNAAAEKGETKLATVPGYHIAGKTGTASIPTPSGYARGVTIASFIGFGPLDDPQFVILVKIDEPKDKPWGSLVAAPVFSSIAKQLFIYYGVPPSEPLPTPQPTKTP